MLRGALSRAGRTLAVQTGRRGLADAAAAAPEVRVPLPCDVYGVSGRYANALYVAATKASALDKVAGDVKTFKSAYDTDVNLKRYILDPSVGRKQKGETMSSIMEGSTDTMKNFIGVLCENGRMNEIEGVLSEFSTLMNAHNKVVFAKVVAATEMSSADSAAVKEALQGFIKKDETLTLEVSIDPRIIGGLVVTVGSKRIDLSAAKTINDVLAEVAMPIQNDTEEPEEDDIKM
eukprot:CAMPEP_0173389502 /NCGR_PEP_ID=MMETSP1356-20130122/12255_1 /TAXON_ID=77927 ORGANISM="Hemiselmis virescens, Strain PCC157" /NCGR_SAMPLE_ID=MMETSP1356 /ASSEMBLY_ACC=CAM_ASM_000847 /LENGTH=232 /DNA_ID=CAMNT_0014346679 /DNA_START=20 /DNA_END=718 /DNA_ORIENTATION=-